MLIVTGCSQVIMPTIQTPCPPDKDNNFITAAMVLALQDYNISAEVVSPEIGMVTTNLFTVSSGLEETVNVLLTGYTYKEAMKITIIIDKSKNLIVMKPLKQQLTGIFGWQLVKLDQRDRVLLTKLSQNMAIRMNIPILYINWIEPIPEKSTVEDSAKKEDIKKVTDDDVIVYKNAFDTKYHKANCRYRRKNATSMSKSEAKKQGLTPCSKCNP